MTDETDLPDLLDRASKVPVLLERNGDLFRLSREEDIACELSPDLVRRTLAETAGSWANLDVDQVIDDLREARRAGSRPTL